jgi:hypothetical protein
MAHLHVDTTYGVTVPAGSEAESATKTSTVAINELMESDTGDIIDARPVNMVAVEVQVEGEGPASLSLTPAAVGTPSTMTVIGVDLTEQPNNRCRFSIRAAGHATFTDPGTAEESVGAEPTVSSLAITSVTYSVAESVRRSVTLDDMVLAGSNGGVAYRETTTVRKPFAIAGRGDLPSGVALGSGGAKFNGAGTGMTVVGVLRESERRADWNGWGADGTNYPAAV